MRDRAIGVLATAPMSVHQALLFRQWSGDVRLFRWDVEIGPEDRTKLDALGIPVVDGGVSALEIDGGRLVGVRLDDERLVPVETVAVARPRTGPWSGCPRHPPEAARAVRCGASSPTAGPLGASGPERGVP